LILQNLTDLTFPVKHNSYPTKYCHWFVSIRTTCVYRKNKTAESLELNFTRLIRYIRSPSNTINSTKRSYVLFRYQSLYAVHVARKSHRYANFVRQTTGGRVWHVIARIPRAPARVLTLAPPTRVCQVAIKSPKKRGIYDDNLTC